MVSFKKFFLLFVTLAGAIPVPEPASNAETGVSIPSVSVSPVVIPTPIVPPIIDDGSEFKTVEQRQAASRMTLQYSPQGRLLFLTGLKITEELAQALERSLGEGAPAKVIFQNFHQWVWDRQTQYSQGALLFFGAKKGGVFIKGPTDDGVWNVGFGLVTGHFPTSDQLEALVNLVKDYAKQGGGLVQVISRPNNFFDPSAIGAGAAKRDVELDRRSRDNKCPADTNLWKYLASNVPDFDPNRDLRWAGTCNA